MKSSWKANDKKRHEYKYLTRLLSCIGKISSYPCQPSSVWDFTTKLIFYNQYLYTGQIAETKKSIKPKFLAQNRVLTNTVKDFHLIHVLDCLINFFSFPRSRNSGRYRKAILILRRCLWKAQSNVKNKVAIAVKQQKFFWLLLFHYTSLNRLAYFQTCSLSVQSTPNDNWRTKSVKKVDGA